MSSTEGTSIPPSLPPAVTATATAGVTENVPQQTSTDSKNNKDTEPQKMEIEPTIQQPIPAPTNAISSGSTVVAATQPPPTSMTAQPQPTISVPVPAKSNVSATSDSSVAPVPAQAPPVVASSTPAAQPFPEVQSMPIRAYLDQTVVPILLDGTCCAFICSMDDIQMFVLAAEEDKLVIVTFAYVSHHHTTSFPLPPPFFSSLQIKQRYNCKNYARHVRVGQGTSSQSNRIFGFLLASSRSSPCRNHPTNR